MRFYGSMNIAVPKQCSKQAKQQHNRCELLRCLKIFQGGFELISALYLQEQIKGNTPVIHPKLYGNTFGFFEAMICEKCKMES